MSLCPQTGVSSIPFPLKRGSHCPFPAKYITQIRLVSKWDSQCPRSGFLVSFYLQSMGHTGPFPPKLGCRCPFNPRIVVTQVPSPLPPKSLASPQKPKACVKYRWNALHLTLKAEESCKKVIGGVRRRDTGNGHCRRGGVHLTQPRATWEISMN